MEGAKQDNTPDKDLLERVETLNAADVQTALKSSLEFEDLDRSNGIQSPAIATSWIGDIAIRSLEPILTPAETRCIQREAEILWETQDGSSSRFSYQYTTNSEAHVTDFPASSAATQAINKALQTRIYPLIRQLFPTILTLGAPLFVYDALVIRYNATSDRNTGDVAPRAGQPLHRDLGLVSVNIMLNDADEFQGGGTFFENQLMSKNFISRDGNSLPKPIKPNGVGHCLLHESSERHAGAATVSGIRDILVLFITAPSAPKIVNARLKQCREYCCSDGFHSCQGPRTEDYEATRASLECRIQHHELALELVPDDGEARQYLGTAWMEYATLTNDLDHLQRAIQCFHKAAQLTPCDSRVYNNLGIALGRLESMGIKATQQSTADDRIQTAEEAYRRGRELLVAFSRAGCDVAGEMEALSRNYGLLLANQDRFRDACDVLEWAAARHEQTERAGSAPSQCLVDSFKLWSFCKSQAYEHVND